VITYKVKKKNIEKNIYIIYIHTQKDILYIIYIGSSALGLMLGPVGEIKNCSEVAGAR